MQTLTLSTKKRKAIIDLTDEVQAHIEQASLSEGLCHLFVQHTTACLTTADLDPGTDLDMLDAFDAMIPQLQYRHPHNPDHVGDHIMSSIIGPQVTVPFSDGKLVLGTWQRIVLVELDGPRERSIALSLIQTESSS